MGKSSVNSCEYRIHLMNPEACFKIFSEFYKLKAFVSLITLTSMGDNWCFNRTCYLLSTWKL